MTPSTGLPALDAILRGLQPGDNVVWRVDAIDDYRPFARALRVAVTAAGERLVYFRFGRHAPLFDDTAGITVHTVHPETSFETFITEIHRHIQDAGPGGAYVFDSLSDLSQHCHSDRMIGNFFKLTGPYLTQRAAVAYFALYRYYHSYHAATPIADTAQLQLDVYRHAGKLYLQPEKVRGRLATTTLYVWEGEQFRAVKESPIIAEVLATSPWPGLPSASYRMVGVWDKMFMHAEDVLAARRRGECPPEREQQVFQQALRLVISRDERVLALAEQYFTLADIVSIWKRMIGTGLIGGKSTGMLLARAILHRTDARWRETLEEHDSFYIGSDVFYTFLVENNCWWERQKQKEPDTFLYGADAVRERLRRGQFPEYIVTRFGDMLDYFGQSPIIVRSSSLLEDAFGNAFAGKYESVFCANQGTREERLEKFLEAVRVVYASTMSVEALTYRKTRGVLDKDEQMALLVQRVSGSPYGDYYFPHLAGVGFSFNPYAWNKQIDPEAGMLRLVFGLGTRAVDRADDDYTRLVALNAPEKRPEANFDEIKRHAQRRVDVLDLKSVQFSNLHFVDVLPHGRDLPIALFATRDRDLEQRAREQNLENVCPWVLTFDPLFKQTAFVKDMRDMLSAIKDAYRSHVDIEFTANFIAADRYKINLVQCRPLLVQRTGASPVPLPALPRERQVFRAHGAIIGHSRAGVVDRLCYVVPSLYGRLGEKDRYAVARLIGALTRLDESQGRTIMLIGPGRWGTSTPALGIPVSFSEINAASILCEIDAMHEGLVPDLSLGTHFFNEIVEMNMLYIAYFVGRPDNVLHEDLLMAAPNRLAALLPAEAAWSDTVRVIDGAADGRRLRLNANALEQTAVLYLE